MQISKKVLCSLSILLGWLVLFIHIPYANAETQASVGITIEERKTPGAVMEFLSNGEFSWRWSNHHTSPTRILTDGEGTYYYADSWKLYAVDQYGQQKWSTAHDGIVAGLARIPNGNLIVMYKAYDISTYTGVEFFNEQGELVQTINYLEDVNFSQSSLDEMIRRETLLFVHAEGIAAYNLNGKPLWLYQNDALIEMTEYGFYSTTVTQLEFSEYGEIVVATDNEFFLLDAQGNLIRQDAYDWVTLNVGEKTYDVKQAADGYFLWGHTRLDRQEMLQTLAELPESDASANLHVTCAQQSYTIRNGQAVVARDANNKELWYTERMPVTWINGLHCNKDGDVFITTFTGDIRAWNSEGNELFHISMNNPEWLAFTDSMMTEDGGILVNFEGLGLFSIEKKSLGVTLNGERLHFEQPPLVLDGTTMVPFRSLFEQMGLTVQWDATKQAVIGSKEGVEIYIKVGDTEARINGELKPLTVVPQQLNGTTYVPLRFVGEATGMEVRWDQEDRMIVMGDPQKLAVAAVRQFIQHMNQADKVQASTLFVNDKVSVEKVVPELFFEVSDGWFRTGITALRAEVINEDKIMVYTDEQSWRPFYSTVKENWYEVQRMPDGKWGISNVSFNPQPDNHEQIHYLTYAKPELGFQFDYTDQWMVNEFSTELGFFITITEEIIDPTQPLFSMIGGNCPCTNIYADTQGFFAEDRLKQLMSTNGNVDEVTIRETAFKMGDYEAIRYETNVIDAGDFLARAVLDVIYTDDMVYAIEYSIFEEADDIRLQRWKEIIEKTVDSIVIN
ncbi:copper amine oxidase N-terminal domain-containing protein [Xylanibacillus composti]|uniref:Copper amine oxidase-like N-terminal domain-containing protein n=1 Tax=Xylanibacillus composti TaxID=1572762 RepID=A0A8J4H5U1_9BACL|nr:stalk domain-containing protein [Xylanibacillus composti]MDT9727193.1 copper amine oxidase N-terminal domain-containing protein [Xylanibacillus composti]GIQ71492.1 hypothetical protein XYCOK13_43160 [Xylanibacillus composti]